MRFFHRRNIAIFYDPAYRFPFPSHVSPASDEEHRADFALWTLLGGGISAKCIQQPPLVSYDQLALVHTNDYLESLSRGDNLAGIFGIDGPIPVDETLRTIRLACGGTVAGAKRALETKQPSLNLSGGFHHAFPSRGGGFSALNDVAVAVRVLFQEGWKGMVGIIDLDAHPPDGIAACLEGEARVWLGSLSGSSWGPLAGVDETLVERFGDREYLSSLRALLQRAPRPDICFVIAGGDVLAGDRLGLVGLTLKGARQRDVLVKRWLGDIPSVWLPAGGYHPDAWKVLAGTGFVVAGTPKRKIRARADPLAEQFARISRQMNPELLGGDTELSEEDVDRDLHMAEPDRKALGFYSRSGIEYALYRFGLLAHIERLGYGRVQVELDTFEGLDRIRVLGWAENKRHLLVEVVLKKQRIGDADFLFVNWLTMRHPLAGFTATRPQLPGQEVPGLGLAPEITEMLGLMAKRFGLSGVAFRPSWYHMAYAARRRCEFIDPRLQSEFEALVADLKGVPLIEATRAIAEHRVRRNGEPYEWPAENMVYRLSRPTRESVPPVAGVHFEITPEPATQ